jgi:DNA-binding response OmpR family regulator
VEGAGAAMRIRVVNSNGQGRLVLVDGDVAIIGRDPDCDIVLDNIFVSRFHARVRRRDDAYELTDLDSRNGVLVEGKPVANETLLPAGAEFSIGPFTIKIVERSRVEQVTQPFSPQTDPLPPLIVDQSTHEVLLAGVTLRPRLSRLEFQLLTILDNGGGAVCERIALGDAIWGEGQWDLNMLHRLVHRLKEKIEPSPEQPRYIITIPGVGYRLQPRQ